MSEVDLELRSDLDRVAAAYREQISYLRLRQLEVLRTFPFYEGVPIDDLETAAERNALRVAEQIAGKFTLDPRDFEAETVSHRRRVEQGVPPEVVRRAHRAVVSVLRDEFVALATQEGLSTAAILEGVRRIWNGTDAIVDSVVEQWRGIELEISFRQQGQRNDFFSRLLNGGFTRDELAEISDHHGLDPGTDYWLTLFPSQDSAVATWIEQRVASTLERPVVGFVHGYLAALTTAEVTDLPTKGSPTAVCVGPCRPEAVHTGVGTAFEVLQAARTFGVSGVVTPSRMSVHLAILRQPEVGEALLERFVTPLGSGPGAAAVIETVREYLRHDKSLQRTAEALYVHTNTVRYRLDKFRTATGAQPDRTLDTVLLWWAMEYEAVKPTLDQ